MNALFIGGTGNISRSVSLKCVEEGIDLHLLTRGTKPADIPGVTWHHMDITGQRDAVLEGVRWDSVVDWIAYTPDDIKRDIALFRNRTDQYVFISSASAYQKPPVHPIITESTPLFNPFWEYSRNKIACEDLLLQAYRQEEFPITIVRPSLTYDTAVPAAIGGGKEYTLIERMKKEQPIIVHGDGTSLWTVTHSEDFAKGFVGLLGNPQAVGEAFHITSDETLTWNQIYRGIAHSIGCTLHAVHIASDFIIACEPSLEGPLLGDKAHSVIFDNSKIKRIVLGFRATIPFHIGIERTLAWFEADRSRQIVKQETSTMVDRILRSYEGK